jgi:hypothetical protein
MLTYADVCVAGVLIQVVFAVIVGFSMPYFRKSKRFQVVC